MSFYNQKTFIRESVKLTNFSCLAVRPYNPDNPDNDSEDADKLCGLNVCIAIAERDITEKLDFSNIFKIWVEDGEIRVPVWVHGGNNYDEKLGTACLFGYICPAMFEDRDEIH